MYLKNNLFLVLIIFGFTIPTIKTTAQSTVGVNQYTGAVNASIPLWTVRANSLAVPIEIGYGNNGIGVDQTAGQAGVGWYLTAGGQVSRSLRDLPDDINVVDTTGSMYGWLHGSASMVSSFVTDHENTVDCDENVYDDLAAFGTLVETDTMYDVEPDIFRISVPGNLSATFVLNTAGQPVLLNNQRLDISLTTDADDQIKSIEVTTLGDVTYQFERHMTVNTFLDTASTYVDPGIANLIEHQREYLMHKSDLTYTLTWSLRSITAPTGEYINFIYESSDPALDRSGSPIDTSEPEKDSLRTYYFHPEVHTHDSVTQFKVLKDYDYEGDLTAIETTWERVSFLQNGILFPEGNYRLKYPLITGIQVIDKSAFQTHAAFNFNYNLIQTTDAPLSTLIIDDGNPSTEDHYPLFEQIFLSSIDVTQGPQKGSYDFEYYGIRVIENELVVADTVEQNIHSFLSSMFKVFVDPAKNPQAKTYAFDSHRSELSEVNTPDQDPYGFYSKRSDETELRRYFLFPNESGVDRVRFSPRTDYTDPMTSTYGFRSENADLSKVTIGALKSIKNPMGGSEEVTYELNRYHDTTISEDVYGGGIRVKNIRIHDGVSNSNDKYVHYDYSDSTGHSSGRLMYQPTYHQQMPYQFVRNDQNIYYPDLESSVGSLEAFKRVHVFSNTDRTEQYFPGYTVAYAQCKVSRPGTGGVVTRYLIDTDLVDLYGRFIGGMKIAPDITGSETCQSGLSTNIYSPINHSLSYRFNGLVGQTDVYAENGDHVSQTVNTYDTSGTKETIHGLKWQPIKVKTSTTGAVDGIRYGIYSIDYGINKVLTSSISKTFDPSDDQIFTSSSVTNTYDVLGRMTESETTDPEGRIYRTRTSFPDDFVSSFLYEDQDSSVQAITKLNEKGQDYVPIEVTRSIEEGGIEKTSSAILNTFSYDEEKDVVFQKSSYQLQVGDPITDYQVLSVDEAGTTALLDMDNRMIQLNTILSRNEWGNVISMEGRADAKQNLTYVNNGMWVGARFVGATDEAIVFDDFEGDQSAYEFLQPIGASPVAGRISGNAHSLATSGNRVYNLTPDGDDYVFSCWVKGTSSGSVSVKLLDDGTTLHTANITTSGGDVWTYYQIAVPVTSGSQQLVVSSDDNVFIDELAMHPEHSTFNYTHYGLGGRRLAETNTRGKTTTFSYDNDGRLELIRNDEGEIVKSYDYGVVSETALEEEVINNLNYDAPIYAGESTTLSGGHGGCTSYKWNIMSKSAFEASPLLLDNFTSPSATTSIPSYDHTFSSSGEWVVKVQSNCGGILRYSSKKIEVEEPLVIDFCYDRNTVIDLCESDLDSYKGCGSTTRVEGAVQFEITLNDDPSNYTIEWFKARSYNGNASGAVFEAEEIIGSANQTTLQSADYHNYFFYFVVKDNNVEGKKYRSAPVFFTAYSSQSNCNNPE